MTHGTYFIIDFDGTFTTLEALPTLAKITLKNNSNKQIIIAEIDRLTEETMNGNIPFPVALKKRISLLNANKIDLEKLIRLQKKSISPSILRNKSFFVKNRKKIYIISGGFKEFIIPVVKAFGITADHVLANTFIFDKKGIIVGFDEKNPLANSGGKTEVIKNLHLSGEIIVIGDGYTDYEIKKNGAAAKFYAFVENINRPSITKKADMVLSNFDELLYKIYDKSLL